MSSLLRMVGQLVLCVDAIRIHHSPIPSRLLSGSEGWSFAILQSCKIEHSNRYGDALDLAYSSSECKCYEVKKAG